MKTVKGIPSNGVQRPSVVIRYLPKISIVIANDWVIGGSFEYKFKRSNVQSVQRKSVTTGTSVALCDQMN